MIKPMLAALVAAFIPATAIAAGIHDFNPANLPSRSRTSSGNGNCHVTQDQSRYCYMKTGNRQYVLSILDVDDTSYPQVLAVNCTSGDYKGWGVLNDSQVRIWASAFCSQV